MEEHKREWEEEEGLWSSPSNLPRWEATLPSPPKSPLLLLLLSVSDSTCQDGDLQDNGASRWKARGPHGHMVLLARPGHNTPFPHATWAYEVVNSTYLPIVVCILSKHLLYLPRYLSTYRTLGST